MARSKPRGRWPITHAMRARDRRRAERAIGHKLKSSQPVHHHTRIQLVVCESTDYHWLLHRRSRTVYAGGNPNTEQVCSTCRECYPFSEFKRKDWFDSHNCRYCEALYRTECEASSRVLCGKVALSWA